MCFPLDEPKAPLAAPTPIGLLLSYIFPPLPTALGGVCLPFAEEGPGWGSEKLCILPEATQAALALSTHTAPPAPLPPGVGLLAQGRVLTPLLAHFTPSEHGCPSPEAAMGSAWKV